MAFSDFQTLGQALDEFQIFARVEPWIQVADRSVNPYFRSELDYRLHQMDVDVSEQAICEALIFPVLWEGLKPFSEHLALWSHTPLSDGTKILGVPDYFLAKKSPLSPDVLDYPLAMLMEAKHNDFALGWGQCVAAMKAAQQINGDPQRIIYGGTTDGFVWQFGKLEGDHLTRHPLEFTLSRLEELFGALHFVLEKCREQVLTPASAA